MAHPGLMVPFVGMIPGGLLPGKKIAIHGMVLMTCNRFSINLQCGPNVNPRDDIAMHLNFRYDAQVPYVVRNSLAMQQWGLEEGHGYLSFGRGHTFEILIQVEHDHYKIFFNGQHFTEFRYRVPVQRVSYVTIDGEVVIHAIKIDGYDLHTAMPAGSQYGPHTTIPLVPTGPYGYAAPPRVGPAAPGMMMPGMMGGGTMSSHAYPGYPMGGVHPGSAAIPVAGAAIIGGTAAMMHGAHMSKAAKKQRKEMKKAMKHHKHAKHSHHGMYGYGGHGGHHKKSSSSSSSSEEEE